MSQQGRLVDLETMIESLQGNSGGPVGPDGSGIINIVGSSPISVDGNPGTYTLTISSDGTLAITYTCDSGSASPSSDNLNILGGTSLAGTTPLVTSGSGSTVTINAQLSQAIASADSTKVGLCNFDSASFTVDADGFVELAGGGIAAVSFSPNSGTDPVVPDGVGLVNMLGDGSLTTVGGLNTLTFELTGLTNHNVLVGAGTTTITKVSPSATSGIPFISQGVLSDPTFGTAVVAGGGTGSTSLTDGGILLGSGTSAVTVTAQPTDGQLLIGSTGVDPVLGSLTSTGGSITITPGSGTINLETDASVATSYSTDSGSAVPALGILTVAGGTLMNTAGATSIVTINADDNVVGSVGSDSGTATPASNSFSIVGTGGISTSAATSIVTIDGSGIVGGLTWNVATGSTQAMSVDNAYFANYNGTLAFTLPSTAAVGDTMEICQMYAGQGFTVAQNSGQTCYIGNTNTTITTGTLASTDDGDWIEIVCRVANTDFQVNIKSGNITVT